MMDEDAYESLDIALRQAYERIGALETLLVEATAKLGWYEEPGEPPVTFDGEFIHWNTRKPTVQAYYRLEAEDKLAELGILTKLQNGAN